jgi:ABC-type nitrate/sulfonate/bicarbonate transport system permease component
VNTQNKWVQRAIVWTALLAIYELLALAVGDFYLPRIEQVATASVDLVHDGRVPIVLNSLGHLLLGSAIAAVVGIPLGLAMGRSKIVDSVAGMYVRGLFVTPLVAVLPLLIILFGVSFRFRIVVVFLFCVFFVVVYTATGAKAVPPSLLETAEAFGVSRLKSFRQVIIPSAMPHIFVGLRLGLANAFGGMITSELWVSQGTGRILSALGRNRDLPPFFALVIVITVIAGFSGFLIKYLERRLTPWGGDLDHETA